MDPKQSDKFNELSPVLELVYVMLTNMVRYLDVYAKDIDAAKLTQYVEAKDALDNAIKKFDALYGLQSNAAEVLDEDSEDDEVAQVAAPVAPQVTPAVQTPAFAPQMPITEEQPYDFASGADPESLQKAKQAVEELKALFADMKKKEEEIEAMPETAAPQQVQQQAYAAPQQMQAPVQMPSPMNTPVAAQPAKDASEIDSILAELRKLQSKGNSQS